MGRPTDIVALLQLEADASEELHPGDSEIEVMRAAAQEIESLRKLLEEVAGDLEAEVKARAPGELARRIERDLEPVRRARAAITPST